MSGHMSVVFQVCLSLSDTHLSGRGRILGTSFDISSKRVAHKYCGGALTGWVFALGSVFLSVVHFSAMRPEILSGYICQVED